MSLSMHGRIFFLISKVETFAVVHIISRLEVLNSMHGTFLLLRSETVEVQGALVISISDGCLSAKMFGM